MVKNLEHLRNSGASETVILLVEDEGLLRNVLTLVLQKRYLVLTAQDGEEALSVSRQFPGRIHVLLSDVVMPKMDGIELRQRILLERPDLKVLLMSAYTHAAADLPILRKPVDMKTLLTEIQRLLAPEFS